MMRRTGTFTPPGGRARPVTMCSNCGAAPACGEAPSGTPLCAPCGGTYTGYRAWPQGALEDPPESLADTIPAPPPDPSDPEGANE